jgi:hypothetical protein
MNTTAERKKLPRGLRDGTGLPAIERDLLGRRMRRMQLRAGLFAVILPLRFASATTWRLGGKSSAGFHGRVLLRFARGLAWRLESIRSRLQTGLANEEARR